MLYATGIWRPSMLIEREIAARRERAQVAGVKILSRPRDGAYGDYQICSSSKKTYRIALRGPGLFDNYCSCPDFAVNTLGTCKHIEALLLRLGKRYGRTLGSRKFARARASISLQYGDTIAVRLRLPADPLPALRKLAEAYFDPPGLLRQEHFQSFHQVIEVFRQADLDAVIYSDVLEYLDRENELAEGLDLERQLLAKLRRGRNPLDGILKTKLLPYQERGALFAACRGRVILADDMGLGKTVQGLAATA